jgi:RHS repeat-associated protein
MNMSATHSIALRLGSNRFAPGAAIDERVAQVDANGAITFMHNDKQNSVIAISDAVGNPVQRRGYGTYGETDPAQMVGTTSAGTSAHPFGYTGRRWDPDLGLYYYRARWYDPSLGTFLETDPIGSLDYVNLYAYVGLEPGNGTDPSGHCRTGFFHNGCLVTGTTIGAATPGVAYIRPNDFDGINDHAQAGDGSPRQIDFRTVDLSDLGASIQTLSKEPDSSLRNAILTAASSGMAVPLSITGLNAGGGTFGDTSVAQQGGIGRFQVNIAGQVSINDNGAWVFKGTVTGVDDLQDYQPGDRNFIGEALTAYGRVKQKLLKGADFTTSFYGSQSIEARGRAPR